MTKYKTIAPRIKRAIPTVTPMITPGVLPVLPRTFPLFVRERCNDSVNELLTDSVTRWNDDVADRERARGEREDVERNREDGEKIEVDKNR
jgi:hypothetical protein